MPNRTKQLAESALLLGIAGVFLFLGLTTPLSGVFSFLLPIPFIILAMRRTGKQMIIVSIAFAVLGLIISSIIGIIFALSSVLLGWAMGYAYKNTNRAFPGIFAGSIVKALSYVFLVYVSSKLIGIDIVQQFHQGKEMVLNNQQLLELRPPEYTVEAWKKLITDIFEMMTILLPFIIMFGSFVSTTIIHWIARLICKRLSIKIPALPPIREWQLPRSLLFFYVVTLLFMLFNRNTMGQTTSGSLLFNLFYALQFLFFIQGLGFVAFVVDKYKSKWRFPYVFAGVFIFLILATILTIGGVVLLLATVLGFVGLLDLGIRLRTRLESRK
ncbi:DUF2232 domain-containing protein [Brevibacillus laterosporus]|uniref:DUF2232 domain-containing protein n=1 Tax=Brevibacillus laterosporus TaxID=1465 RepID=UPI00037E8451|nr:DUF2232 domain-containing protein [Brevibacillus laterosporus]ATO49376.1 hypothetical protein BrL25_09790 [Brevibacillus laterosporus DSM 25]MBG9775851.1 membrane protein [Brevibacillus laterosporus]MBG9800744.1 membrane protein [Brevibacillus laterosporus]MED2004546.1 DUF2232 domain-containing protein [Brevibacillus laterosporus]MED4762271.1 DUF2232 domain-containing protein [Brevibacillus laterosporus]